MKDRIISEYGRALKKGSDKTIVDFNESLSIDFNFQVYEINDLVREFNWNNLLGSNLVAELMNI